MIDFANNRDNKLELSGFEIIYDYCDYGNNNLDYWLNFSKKISYSVEQRRELLESAENYIVSLEEPEDEK